MMFSKSCPVFWSGLFSYRPGSRRSDVCIALILLILVTSMLIAVQYMVRNPALLPSMDLLKGGEVPRKRRMMAEVLRGFWESCNNPDRFSKRPFVAEAIIANPPSFAHAHLGQALGIPVQVMFIMPWTATLDFPYPLANISSHGVGGSTANHLWRCGHG